MDLPPSFWELQKDVSDLFTAGYFRNILKLEVKTRTRPGIRFRFGGEQFLKYKEYLAFVEAHYEFKEYGVTFKENWNTDNVLTTGVMIEDWIKGLKWTLETTLFPEEPHYRRESRKDSSLSAVSSNQKWKFGDKMLKIETLYSNDLGSLSFETVFSTCKSPAIQEMSGPLMKLGAVYKLPIGGLMLGCGIGADVGTRSIFDCVVGAHFESDIFTFNGFLTNAQMLSTSLSQRFFGGDLESGIACSWSINDPDFREFAVACRWKQDEDTTFRIKCDNIKWIGFSICQRIRSGVKLFLSVMANGQRIFNGDWYQDIQLGACLELGDDDSSSI